MEYNGYYLEPLEGRGSPRYKLGRQDMEIATIGGFAADRLYWLFYMHSASLVNRSDYNCHGLASFLAGKSSSVQDRSYWQPTGSELGLQQALQKYVFPIGTFAESDSEHHSSTILGVGNTGNPIAVHKIGAQALEICDAKEAIAYTGEAPVRFFSSRMRDLTVATASHPKLHALSSLQ
jgi:hypothetical protein